MNEETPGAVIFTLEQWRNEARRWKKSAMFYLRESVQSSKERRAMVDRFVKVEAELLRLLREERAKQLSNGHDSDSACGSSPQCPPLTPKKPKDYLWQPRPFVPLSPQSAAQIAQPSIPNVKDHDSGVDSAQACVQEAQPGVSRVAQRPDATPEDRETSSGLGSSPTMRPATGPTNSQD